MVSVRTQEWVSKLVQIKDSVKNSRRDKTRYLPEI